MNIGFQLFQLQTIDSELDNAGKRIEEINTTIENNSAVDQAQANLRDSEADLKAKRVEFNSIDYDIQQKKVKKSQSEENLYGGKIKNPKELQDLQLEISSLTKILSELDDKLLEALVVLDKAEEVVKQRESELSQAVSQFETMKSRLVAEKNNLENSIQTLNVKRSSLVAQIDKGSLDTYNTLRKSKNGFAISGLQEDCCSACGALLTASQCQQARSSSKLFFCSNCGRIVYGS